MTVASRPAASAWTCDGCGVTTSNAAGKPAPMPDTWEQVEDVCFCLRCRRERAADAAADCLPADDREARAKVRRTSLIEFELRRDPERPNNLIARSCRTSALAIAKARKRMDAEASSG